jgi:methylated-DNA-[protein]-cysteine S-methyltransferase
VLPIAFAYHDSPLGLVEVAGTPDAITALCFVEARRADVTSNEVVDAAVEQVAAYFAGTLRAFDLPLALNGTAFQRAVWAWLRVIPSGQTVTYRAVAEAIGHPRAIRAVGAAVGRNPVSIIVPCHRVVGSDGNLTGYGGGLWRKEWLLRHEGAVLL